MPHWRRSIFHLVSCGRLIISTSSRRTYVDHPRLGPEPFYSKLQQQLAGAPPHVVRLAAEAVWVLLLFPHENQFGPNKKRQRIKQIMALSNTTITNDEMLADNVLKGVGHPGICFLVKILDELTYLVKVLLHLKSLPESKRRTLLEADPWQFCDFAAAVEGADHADFVTCYFSFVILIPLSGLRAVDTSS